MDPSSPENGAARVHHAPEPSRIRPGVAPYRPRILGGRQHRAFAGRQNGSMVAVLLPSTASWTRHRHESLLAGVCAVLSRQLRLPVWLVRAAITVPVLVVLPALPLLPVFYDLWADLRLAFTLAAPPVLGYVALWWALPDDSASVREQSMRASAAAVRGLPSAVVAEPPPRMLRTVLRWSALALLVGVAAVILLITIGVDLLQLLPGAQFRDPIHVDALGTLLLLGGLMSAAVTVGLVPLADLDRDRWSGRPGHAPGRALAALLAGSALLLLATALTVTLVVGPRQAVQLLGATLAVAGMIALLLVPWGRRLWRGVREEAGERAVLQHHQETTAHLHDSVLQTLTVLQRPGADAEEMRALARIQERELRRWLYRAGADDDAPAEVRTAVETLTAELEDLHGHDVHTVIVGEAPLAERTGALLGALREATVNACRHAGEGIDVFVDIGEDTIEAYVRDRGPGFDPATLPEDRLGVRESIIGRMRRAGGTATVRPAPGGGTEVALVLPRRTR